MRISDWSSDVCFFRSLLMDKLVALGGAAIVNIVIARHLGPYDFGLLNYVVSMAALAAAVGGLGITGPLMRDLAYDPDDEPKILGSASVLTTADRKSTRLNSSH